MAYRNISLHLPNDAAIESFEKFKLKHGFTHDWEVFAACFDLVHSLDNDKRASLLFLKNGDKQIHLSNISDEGQPVQTNIIFTDASKRAK